MAKTLTKKQELFCQLFVKYDHGPRAYKEAYPKSTKWKPSSVSAQVTRALNRAGIKARIQELRDREAVKNDVSPEKVLREFARIGFSDVRDFIDEDGKLKPARSWPKHAGAAVQSIKIKQDPEGGDLAEVKLWPKTNALESLSKHLGLFEKDNRQRRNVDLNVSTEELVGRLEELRRKRAGKK